METLYENEARYVFNLLHGAVFNQRSGAVKCAETFTDEYNLIDGVWFPASRRMFQAENGKVITRVIEFRNPRIRFNNEQAAR